MYLLVIFLSFLTSIITMFTGRFIGRSGTCFFTVGGLILSLFLSCFLYFEVALSSNDCYIFFYR